MQTKSLFTLLISLLLLAGSALAQTAPFRFAFISDTHIGSPNGDAEEDLRRTVADINRRTDVEFVVLTGDITELGTEAELRTARRILDSLKVPYYIIPGNHDTGWSGSGGLDFTTIFGSDKFAFTHKGVRFFGTPSGPYVRMSDGHVPRESVNWLKAELKKVPADQPVVFLNHYPLDPGLDNWYEVIDMLKEKNTVLVLCGHGHNNRPVKAEDIPAVMGRSNLRAKEEEGGYNLVDFGPDSIRFTVRRPVSGRERTWRAVALTRQQYDRSAAYTRPDFSVNQKYPEVKAAWTYHSGANVISTPAVVNGLVVFGNQAGLVEALSLENGKRKWTFNTQGPIFSSPAAEGGRVVLGSADGHIYCLSDKGKLQWKVKTGGAVLGAPLIQDGVVYIGGSDGSLRALEMATGKERWRFTGIGEAVVSQPVISDSLLVFGAWDRHLYALNRHTGRLAWKWNNGSPIRNYSPASVIPVIRNNAVFIAAPDRYLTALDLHSGEVLWRTNEATVRESIGGSADGRLIYGKTMNDTVVAFSATRDRQPIAWKLHAGYGYEHTPSMLLEKEGLVYFGTKSGVVYALDRANPSVRWAHKIDNSMVNTVRPLGRGQVLASTMDGKVSLLLGPSGGSGSPATGSAPAPAR